MIHRSEHALPIEGVELAAVATGLRYKQRDDLCLVRIGPGAAFHCLYTTNRFCAAPVAVARAHQACGKTPRCLVINAGNANAGTGKGGETAALEVCAAVAAQEGCDMTEVLPYSTGLDRGVMTIVLAHTTFSMCYVSVVVSSRLATFDMSLEEAALDLGSTPFEAFRLVTLPIIAPAVISGWLLAFTLSLDDLVIASFTSGPSATTLPIKIFSAVRLGVSPEINALSTIMIAIVTIGVISASLISKRAAVRQRLEEQQAVRS